MVKQLERSARRICVADVCEALEALAPLRRAQKWDNVGLLAGDREAAVRRVLTCIDLTPAVVDEAVRERVQLVVAYHPPIFKPLSRLTMPSDDTGALVLRCIKAGIAIYSTHTALDAAEGGTNDRMAQLCGIKQTQPLEYVGNDRAGDCKVVVFVPEADVDTVAEAMFQAGAGCIGDYEKCSYRLAGTGTFRGTESTKPVIGEAGRYETVAEIRIESVTPQAQVPAVIEAIRRAHPYEEPAFDIYPLRPVPERGIGRYGDLPQPMTLAALARKLKNLTEATCVQMVGETDRRVTRAVICVGAAGSLPFAIPLGPGDVIITGEIRHHDALAILRRDCSAIALGHWASEHPVLEPFAKALNKRLARLDVLVSTADCEPFAPV
ncbi:MAG: Nif3-like dinuclear metal center hexameric protein [Phycisphaerae bacterium]